VCEGLKAIVTDRSTDALNYTWNLGGTIELDTAVITDSIVHIFPFGNSYFMTLLTRNHVCTDSMIMQVPDIGLKEALDSLPNVFTPDGDGLNDCFQITPPGGLNDCATITIFNRLGTIVFQGDTSHRCLNGKTTSGNDCPDGVYF